MLFVGLEKKDGITRTLKKDRDAICLHSFFLSFNNP